MSDEWRLIELLEIQIRQQNQLLEQGREANRLLRLLVLENRPPRPSYLKTTGIAVKLS